MFNLIARLMLTATALAPVALTYAWAAWSDNKNLSLILIISSVLLLIMCVALLNSAKNNLEKLPLKINYAEAADREHTAFLLLYISPLLTEKFSGLQWSMWIPILIIFGFISATSYNYHFSPLLGILGWHFYKVTSSDGVTYVLLTKRQLRTTVRDLEVRQLTEYVLIEFN